MKESRSEAFGHAPRWFVRNLARFYYPRLEITRADRIPATGPVLLVSNHPNSLLDPPLLGIAAQRPIHFLAKAPLFRIPIFGQVMHALGMLPAYRACDDPSQMKRNVDSLSRAAQCLADGRAVGIFPEGKSHDLPVVDQVKSGAARIALQAWALGTPNLTIIPVGLNHQKKERFRSAVWIRIGQPILLKNWISSAPEEERARVRALTQEIDQRLKLVTIHLDEKAWSHFLEDLEHLYPLHRRARLTPSLAALRQRKRIADAMNYFLRQDRGRADALAASIDAYRRNVRADGLSVSSSLLRSTRWRWFGLALARTHGIVAGFLLALPGTIFHLVPFFVTRGLAHLMQTNVRATHALTRLGVGLPVYVACYALASWLLLAWLSPGWLALLLGVMPFLGAFALRYWYFVREHLPAMWHEWTLFWHPTRLRQLQSQRESLSLAALAKEYGEAIGKSS